MTEAGFFSIVFNNDCDDNDKVNKLNEEGVEIFSGTNAKQNAESINEKIMGTTGKHMELDEERDRAVHC